MAYSRYILARSKPAGAAG